jgi:hypothetical protein
VLERRSTLGVSPLLSQSCVDSLLTYTALLLGQRNTKATSFWLLKLYGLIGLLIITLVLIGVVVLLSKVLPDGDQIHYAPFEARPAGNRLAITLTSANYHTQRTTGECDGWQTMGNCPRNPEPTAAVFVGCRYDCAVRPSSMFSPSTGC